MKLAVNLIEPPSPQGTQILSATEHDTMALTVCTLSNAVVWNHSTVYRRHCQHQQTTASKTKNSFKISSNKSSPCNMISARFVSPTHPYFPYFLCFYWFCSAVTFECYLTSFQWLVCNVSVFVPCDVFLVEGLLMKTLYDVICH